MRDSKFYKVLDAAPVRAITSSTDATPVVVTTAAAHGLSTGDLVMIFGHTTNLAANGLYRITVTSTTKFSLQDKDSGDDIAGTGAGAGSSGVFAPAPKIIFAEDYRNAVITFDTDGGGDAAFTLKIAGSVAVDAPNFGAAKGPSNQYDWLDVIDLEDGASVDGDTGFVVASADDNRHFEVNINGMEYITVVPTAGTAGEITVTIRLFDNQ